MEGTDYTMTMSSGTAWIKGSDGYYYYTSPVAADDTTGVLISSCTEKTEKAPAGYRLSVEIIAEAIQSVPTTTVGDVWGSVASVDSNGTLIVN